MLRSRSIDKKQPTIIYITNHFVLEIYLTAIIDDPVKDELEIISVAVLKIL